MRKIDRPSRFRRDYQRESKGPYRKALETDLVQLLACLVNDETPPLRFQDHALAGEWQGYRDCHVKPDLVLVYRRTHPDILELARLGTHSELGF